MKKIDSNGLPMIYGSKENPPTESHTETERLNYVISHGVMAYPTPCTPPFVYLESIQYNCRQKCFYDSVREAIDAAIEGKDPLIPQWEKK